MIPVLSQPPAEAHIAPCGLFCTNCRRFKRGKCPGCQVAPRFSRCPVRICCAEKGITVCADCDEFGPTADFRQCRKVNNLIAKVFGMIFGTDRPSALAMLRNQGREAYLEEKRNSGRM